MVAAFKCVRCGAWSACRTEACPYCGIAGIWWEDNPAPPCHSKPHAQWCDKNGPGGFMGHTCWPVIEISVPTDIEELTEATVGELAKEIRRLYHSPIDSDFRAGGMAEGLIEKFIVIKKPESDNG